LHLVGQTIAFWGLSALAKVLTRDRRRKPIVCPTPPYCPPLPTAAGAVMYVTARSFIQSGCLKSPGSGWAF